LKTESLREKESCSRVNRERRELPRQLNNRKKRQKIISHREWAAS